MIKPIKGIPRKDMLLLQKYLIKRWYSLGYEEKHSIIIPREVVMLIDTYFYKSDLDGMLYPRKDLNYEE